MDERDDVISNELFRLAISAREQTILSHVRACLATVVDDVVSANELAGNEAYERAVRSLSWQLEESRHELYNLRAERDDARDFARTLSNELRGEMKALVKLAKRCTGAEAELARCRVQLKEWPERLENMGTELAATNQRNKELVEQVEALIDVQKEFQQNQWLFDGMTSSGKANRSPSLEAAEEINSSHPTACHDSSTSLPFRERFDNIGRTSTHDNDAGDMMSSLKTGGLRDDSGLKTSDKNRQNGRAGAAADPKPSAMLAAASGNIDDAPEKADDKIGISGLEKVNADLILPFLNDNECRKAASTSKRMLVRFRGHVPNGVPVTGKSSAANCESMVGAPSVGATKSARSSHSNSSASFPDESWKCTLCAKQNDAIFPICQFCKSPGQHFAENTREQLEELKKYCTELENSTNSARKQRRPSLLARLSPYIRGRATGSAAADNKNSSSSKVSVGIKEGEGAKGESQNSITNASGGESSVGTGKFNGLSVDHLRMVLALDKRAKHLEAALLLRTTEMEDLRARNNTLTHTKQALMKTITEKEVEAAAIAEQRNQARAQLLSDKEIITYLDVRSQELELAAKEAEKRGARDKQACLRSIAVASQLTSENETLEQENMSLAMNIVSLKNRIARLEQELRLSIGHNDDHELQQDLSSVRLRRSESWNGYRQSWGQDAPARLFCNISHAKPAVGATTVATPQSIASTSPTSVSSRVSCSSPRHGDWPVINEMPVNNWGKVEPASPRASSVVSTGGALPNA